MPCRLCGIIIIRYYLLADSADAEGMSLTAIYLSCWVCCSLFDGAPGPREAPKTVSQASGDTWLWKRVIVGHARGGIPKSEVLVDCPTKLPDEEEGKEENHGRDLEEKGLKGCSLQAEIYDRHIHTRDVSMPAEVTTDRRPWFYYTY